MTEVSESVLLDIVNGQVAVLIELDNNRSAQIMMTPEQAAKLGLELSKIARKAGYKVCR